MNYSKLFAALAVLSAPAVTALADTSVLQLNPTAVEVIYDDGGRMLVDFYGPNIFRLFRDPSGGEVRDPKANPPARILVNNPRTDVGDVKVTPAGDVVSVSTPAVRIDFDRKSDKFAVTDLATGKTVVRTTAPMEFKPGKSSMLTFSGQPGEYFYGGGVQNGRFSHKGKVIEIRNTNSWTDGGVASPTPYYWSTGGYGLMWHTFEPGVYDFGASEPGSVRIGHQSPYLDVFMMVSETPVALLNDFYQLTGNPVLLPKFGFYEGHLNAYNRDYWKEVEAGKQGGVLFEDGKRYTESQKDNGGIKESLNGELPGNYQFSARAVIDRYNAADMPLGWVLPNDGYGAGYGQTSTLDGNVQNLKEFGDYARSKGVEIGLWTQSDLHPVEGIEPLLQRDIVKEVRDAGVRVLKTDVAWVGAGYSFGLNGVADVAEIMPYYGNNARPFIISLDGWAGTQRYAGIWTGDQTGGEWEYIRFHIPTYIGSGLSGQPNITSDMDGIFGGKNLNVNVRDFQWKTFTPMELNMDGWGRNPKYPQAVDDFQPDIKGMSDINRAYLKLKSELMPYAYTAAREAVDGKPMVRAMFLDYPNDFTYGTATKYQFLYGPYLLVAPIYEAGLEDADGHTRRNNIYLPEGTWFDYFSGDRYEGGVVWNQFATPLWKLPVFVKADAIIPMVNPNNNPSQINKNLRIYELWPQTYGEYTEYDDDGTTEAYRFGKYVNTRISSEVKGSELTVTIDPTTGGFDGFVSDKSTELRINVSDAPKSVSATVGGKKVKLTQVTSLDAFNAGTDVYFLNENPNRLKPYGVQVGGDMRPQLWVKLAETDVTKSAVKVQVKGFELNPSDPVFLAQTAPAAPVLTVDPEKDINAYDITLRWEAPIADAQCLEIEYNGMLYTNLSSSELANEFTFDELNPQTEYSFKVRSKNPAGVSEWVPVTFTTKNNPLEFAISGITATCTIPSQPGFAIGRLFDFEDKGDTWHTIYNKPQSTPFDVVMDLGSFNTLDRFDYLPRLDAGNGTITKGTVAISENGTDWVDLGSFSWPRSSDIKTFMFDGNPLVRYIKLHVDESTGGFGSGRELFVFKVPGTSSYISGDINNDGKVDENDLMSYTNYTGLRRGDGDFDYVSMGDVNRNGLLDAYDISVVATQLDGGIENAGEEIGGSISFATDKRTYAVGDEVRLTVKGTDLSGLNAISFALPYDPAKYEYLGVEAEAVKGMANLTYDRLHTGGDKVLYPTFVNVGDKNTVNGTEDLFVIKFRAKVRGAFATKAEQVIIVDKQLGSISL